MVQQGLPATVRTHTRLASTDGLIKNSAEEPDAGKLHVRICEGGVERLAPLLDPTTALALRLAIGW